MNQLNNLQDLLQYQLGIIFDAENQLIQALPVLERSALNINLKKIFSLHLDETKMHQDRMLGMAHDLNINLKDNTCGAMQKLINQTNKFCTITGDQATKDAGLITYVQRIEHYEIASYTNVIQYAQALDYNCLTKCLQQNLAEETNTYKNLRNLSMDIFNKQTRNYFAI